MKNEFIQAARQANLAEYLLNVGVPLVRQGNRYKHKEHDSLTFTENAYYWNSQGEHGNAVDYLVRYMNMDFISAVNALVQCVARADARACEFSAADLSINVDNARTIKYLNKARQIGRNVIDYLIENKLLFQETRTNNAVFPMYDENNTIIGAELQGTGNKRFKGVMAGSKYGCGFNVRFSNDDTYAYALFFESAVDLISFMDCKRNYEKKTLEKCILISMSGLKSNIIHHTLTAFKGALKVVLCVDNDKAGREFKDTIKNKGIPFIVCAPDEKFKDWNEQVIALKKSIPISRLMKSNDFFSCPAGSNYEKKKDFII